MARAFGGGGVNHCVKIWHVRLGGGGGGKGNDQGPFLVAFHASIDSDS